jgi:hypothetical protein
MYDFIVNKKMKRTVLKNAALNWEDIYFE